MSYRDDRETGRWEMRAKFPKGDAAYHPVLLLWPQDGGSDDGEVDFAETTSASDSVSFFLHHGSGDQEFAKKQIDLTQWHNYAVEVTSDGVTRLHRRPEVVREHRPGHAPPWAGAPRHPARLVPEGRLPRALGTPGRLDADLPVERTTFPTRPARSSPPGGAVSYRPT